jgi:ABC-type nitrate/sulfonate/bicarbonate transport system substrate-binding protein
LLRKRGLKPDEYKILNVGTARLPALVSGNVPAAVLNGLETAKAIKQGFRPLARAADEIELATGGLGTSIASIQSKRDVFRAVIQATLESIRVSATQKEKAVPVLMKQFAITQEDANLILDIVQKAWALDGRPTPGSQKFEFELAQRDMGLEDPPKPEQVYDFSILDEVVRR